MTKWIILVLLNFVNTTMIDDIKSVNYCTYSCDKYMHTVCQRAHSCGGNSECHALIFNETWREFVLDKHNKIRSRFAKSKGVTNMIALNYDLELEYIARCWSNSCPEKNDRCRITSKFDTVGQNSFDEHLQNIAADINKFDTTWMIHPIDIWNEEPREGLAAWLPNFFGDWLSEITYAPGNPIADKYYQLTWALTTHVGCSKSRSSTRIFFYCNYGPAGNIPGEKRYDLAVADSCNSSCARLKLVCNTKYEPLCGHITPIPTGAFTDPDIKGHSKRVQSSIFICLLFLFYPLYLTYCGVIS